ncbi:MAG: BolA/IbaG family iron-sulfur metabolism protein [Candidatus Marinimicrobia bacterium]|jgi:acid stress-induced BolA-like protein IbaG/YrbA|nr:BolA/IbaG family iron-sulfur metabolism protein [Candidatus Neomarinimicrobiota bacterium]MDD9888008.1 BolA/IbaG family iron-sulfur metabolism protein [Candidatus Neomarinimicrobiota bacterium]MDD9931725.1 BolA/IbaG family iron-sulfur metabolism protein [Candidatus Neomarinimicrobiota bacterium]MDP6992172.1 BolA/IbaG family iron-sulfur metabolism protein [Candidatus Neomarinimicrobiota bacterium]|tara:strand:- start:439 stop:687 length:249 start_codon:yes stop_codon:yes gene_type:complete
MEPDAVKALIESGIPDAKVEVVDTTGTKDHFSAVVISDSFDGLNLVEQHQVVYKAVGDHMTREIHALQLKTYSPQQWEKQNS